MFSGDMRVSIQEIRTLVKWIWINYAAVIYIFKISKKWLSDKNNNYWWKSLNDDTGMIYNIFGELGINIAFLDNSESNLLK